MKHIPKDSLILLNRRRLLGRLVLGATAALALTACGGGSDGDSSSSLNLRAAYDRVDSFMTHTDVDRVVGVPAGDQSSDYHRWVDGNEQLSVSFSKNSKGVWVAVNVNYRVIGGNEIEKVLDLN